MYSTYKGKTYLKSVIVRQANEVLARGDRLILPSGVVFRASGAERPYVALQPLPFVGRFLAEPQGGGGEPLHALAWAVEEVISVPDTCPPIHLWEKVPKEMEK